MLVIGDHIHPIDVFIYGCTVSGTGYLKVKKITSTIEKQNISLLYSRPIISFGIAKRKKEKQGIHIDTKRNVSIAISQQKQCKASSTLKRSNAFSYLHQNG
jgi:hypothetical protein